MSTIVDEQVAANVTEIMESIEEDLSKKAHIVTPAENALLWGYACQILGHDVSSKDLVSFARDTGASVTALCQYTWIPSETPGNHDTCMACMAVAQARMSEG